MAKGIRVNQLAKDLNVESKVILAKLRDEGLGEKAPNHMSVLPVGLAESVREWFHQGHGAVATAVETAAPVEVAAPLKTRASRTRKKTAKSGEKTSDEGDSGATTATMEAPATSEAPQAESDVLAESESAAAESLTQTTEPVPVAPVEAKPSRTRGARHAKPAAEPQVSAVEPATTEPVPAESATAESATAPAEPLVPAATAPLSAAAAAPAVSPDGGAGHTILPTGEVRAAMRPTVTLESKRAEAAERERQAEEGEAPAVAPPVERKAVIPAPRLAAPAPAQMQGPRVIREEKPDFVAPPRPRRPAGAPGDIPGFTQARPQAGRGVRVVAEDDEEAKKKAKSKTLSTRRRGQEGRRGEADEKLREFSEQDLKDRSERLGEASKYVRVLAGHLRQRERTPQGPAKTIVQKGEPVEIIEPISVKSLAVALGVKANDILSRLLRQGVFANINQNLEREAAESMALDFGIELKIKQEATLEDLLEQEIEAREVDPDSLSSRPPVVTILGHVDHGKTSLLDKIRHANVAAGEAGGITQHTAAWMVEVGEGDARRRVTFIDTPGHQAFTAMRARGANMTDVVVLVVSAAEGVQPQTLESINHARAAGVPLVVAMNKIDRADANPDMVLGQLAKEGLNPVEWGGETEVVRTSATTGEGIPTLIEILDYQSELLELKANPSAAARGMVIESRVDPGRGAVATVLVQDGTLKTGDIMLCGAGYGRIRGLWNDRAESIDSATPATPVIVSGLSEPPQAGDKFYVLDDLDRARSISEQRQVRSRQQTLADKSAISLDNVMERIRTSAVKEIRLIVKADVQGSVETLRTTLAEVDSEEVKVRVLHAAVGAINESDIELADASDAVIIGFHVVPDDMARSMAEQRRVEVRTYQVIYEIFDDLKKAMSGMLEPEIREKYHGRAEIRKVFKVSRVGSIAGCMVVDGHIQRGSKIRLIRDGVMVTEDLTIDSLKRIKDDVREVKQGFECGIKLDGYDDVKEGDTLEAYIRETIQRTL